MRAALADTVELKKTEPLNETAQRGWMSWDQIVERRDELADRVAELMEKKWGVELSAEEYSTVQQHLVLCLYTYIPPMRNDYGEVQITSTKRNKRKRDDGKQLNWYFMDAEVPEGDELIFNDYKTAKHYGSKRVKVPKKLADVVADSLQLAPRLWLLSGTGTPAEALGKDGTLRLIKKALNNQYIGPSLIRHITKTEWSVRGIGGADQLAKGMCHSTGMAEAVYNQNPSTAADNSMGIVICN